MYTYSNLQIYIQQVKKQDDNGKIYYENHKLHVTSWGFPKSPPPPLKAIAGVKSHLQLAKARQVTNTEEHEPMNTAEHHVTNHALPRAEQYFRRGVTGEAAVKTHGVVGGFVGVRVCGDLQVRV